MKRRTIISSFFGEIIRRGWLVGEAKRAHQGAGVVALGVAVLCAVAGVAALTPAEAGALSYQKKVPVQFTFNTSLEVSLSSADLVINDLAPGTSADSNIVTVTVLSNSLAGYSLGATVGDDEEANPDGAIYNTDALIHTTYTADDNANIADKKYEKPFFANLTTSQTTITGDNTWGYSFSRDGGTNWINAHKTGEVNDAGYNGLPLYNSGTPAELKATTAPSAVGGDSVLFKIGAKAGTEQSSGEYNNVVNFVAVANPAPEALYMQDVNSWKGSLAEGEEIEVRDRRDEKTYTVTKMKDGNVWMTQNLDLDLSTGKTLTSADTNISADWTPALSTYATDDTTWEWSYTTPESYDPGDVCWTGTPEDEATEACSQSGSHYHLGNFYNWTAAVAMNDSSSYEEEAVVEQSICPAGWALPKAGPETGAGSYQNLVSQYGWTDESYMMEDPYIWGTPLFFPLSGNWDGELNDVGYYGYFWSSVVDGGNGAYNLGFGSDGGVYPDGSNDRDDGFSVRCVAL